MSQVLLNANLHGGDRILPKGTSELALNGFSFEELKLKLWSKGLEDLWLESAQTGELFHWFSHDPCYYTTCVSCPQWQSV